MSEIDRLRDRVAELEELLGLHLELPNKLGLTRIEVKIVGMLVRREIVDQQFMHWALYGGLPECDQPDPKTIDVHICNIRRKLRPHGLAIKNRYNVGYYIESEARAALKNLSAYHPANGRDEAGTHGIHIVDGARMRSAAAAPLQAGEA